MTAELTIPPQFKICFLTMAHTVEDMLRSAFRRFLTFRSLAPNLHCGMPKRRWRLKIVGFCWEKISHRNGFKRHQTDHGSTRCLSSWFLRTCLIVIEAVCDFTGDTFFCRWSYMVLVPRHPWRPAGFFFGWPEFWHGKRQHIFVVEVWRARIFQKA